MSRQETDARIGVAGDAPAPGGEPTADRLARERAFHDDRYADEHREAAAKYYAVETGRLRYRELVDGTARPHARVLEYGCGVGSSAFRLAEGDAEVVGIDISGVGVAAALDRARTDGVGTASFAQMDAETLAFRSASFDVVCGSGIVHHLDVERALSEVRRVLRPGGCAIFYEPLGTNPVINLYRRFTPSMRTPDEHPLVARDFELMRRFFGEVEVEHHTLASLLAVGLRRWPRLRRRAAGSLQRLDQLVLRDRRMLTRYAWMAVIRLRA